MDQFLPFFIYFFLSFFLYLFNDSLYPFLSKVRSQDLTLLASAITMIKLAAEWKEEWMDGWMDGWMDEWKGWTVMKLQITLDGLTIGWIDGLKDE